MAHFFIDIHIDRYPTTSSRLAHDSMQLTYAHLLAMQKNPATASSCGHKTSHCPLHQTLHRSPAVRHDARQWPMPPSRAIAVSFDKEAAPLLSNGHRRSFSPLADTLGIGLNTCQHHDSGPLSRPVLPHRTMLQTAQPAMQHGPSALSTAASHQFLHCSVPSIPSSSTSYIIQASDKLVHQEIRRLVPSCSRKRMLSLTGLPRMDSTASR